MKLATTGTNAVKLMNDRVERKPDVDERTLRWRALGGVVTIWFTTYFVRLAWVNVSASASRTFGSSATELGSFITFFFVGYVVANVTGGFLVDRFGARRVVTTALCVLALATFCFSQVTTTAQGWGVQLVMGLSSGSFYAAVIKLVAAWYPSNERGMASGLLFAAGPFAVIAANLIYPSALQVLGWTNLYVVLSIYVVLVAIVAATLIRSNGSASLVMTSAPVTVQKAARQSVLSLNLILLCGACFGTGWGTWGFTFCSNILLVRGDHAFSPSAAALVALWFGIGGVVIIPIYGFLSDRFPTMRPHLYILELLVMIAALFNFSAQSTLFGFCLSAFILGAAAYAFLPVLGAMLPDLVVPGTLGATAGIANAAGQLAAAIAPLAIGMIIDRSGSLGFSLSTLALGPALGAVCLIALLIQRHRNSLSMIRFQVDQRGTTP